MSEVSFQPAPIATWNPAIGVWEKKDQVNLLCAHSELFSEVWPTSGQMVTMPDGSVCALPMPVRLTADSESSSLESGATLLRSPKASEASGGALGEAEALKRGNTVGVRDQVMDLVAGQGLRVSRQADNELLPTPNTMEHREIKTPEQIAELKLRSPGGYRNLREEVINNLPTQTVRDYKDGQAAHERNGVVQTDTLARAIFNSEVPLMPTTRVSMANGATAKEVEAGNPKGRIETEVMLGAVNWGKFEPAIKRWEAVMGRPAPAPTLPDGKDGNHRLSPWLTEWMMGLPEGWICSPEIGLTRNEQLKAAGNGVCPQQAMLALEMLLEGVELKMAGGGQVNLPTPTVSDTFTSNLKSSQQKEGSMHSVTLPQAVERLVDN